MMSRKSRKDIIHVVTSKVGLGLGARCPVSMGNVRIQHNGLRALDTTMNECVSVNVNDCYENDNVLTENDCLRVH